MRKAVLHMSSAHGASLVLQAKQNVDKHLKDGTSERTYWMS